MKNHLVNECQGRIMAAICVKKCFRRINGCNHPCQDISGDNNVVIIFAKICWLSIMDVTSGVGVG